MHDLIQSAVRATSMSELVGLLRALAERTSSYGCVLWRVTPAEGEAAKERLFIVADWFSDERRRTNHLLSLKYSYTGEAVRANEQQWITDISRVPAPDSFLRETGITSFCSTPIRFLDEISGAVNIYRRDGGTYTQEIRNEAKELAHVLPALLQVIEDEVSFRLISHVDKLLGDVRHLVPSSEMPFEHVKPTMTKVCEAIAAALNCVEVSAFLEDRVEAQGKYRLAGTTWNLMARKTSYEAREDEGLTGWSLAHPEVAVIIFDLRDAGAIDPRYSGMKWMDSLDIKNSLGGHPKIRDIDSLRQPLSFMSAPIMDGKDVVGILRCSVGLGPVYFDQRQHAILQRIASRIGPFWKGFLRNRSLEALVENVSKLNTFAQAELMKNNPDESRIHAEAVRILNAVVPGAQRTDVQLFDDSNPGSRFAAYGPVGARAIRSGKTTVVTGTTEMMTDPSTKRRLLAPLVLKTGNINTTGIYGVLDIRTSIDRDFPDFAIRMSELLASQLALYRKLTILVRDLNANVSDLKKLRDQQTQINEDLAHQLKSPTMAAYRRVSDLLRLTDRGMPESDLKTRLLRIRGVCARAMHVAINSWLFAKLARGEAITPAREPLDGEELRVMVLNTAFDASYLARGEQKNTFHVDPSGFAGIQAFQVDRDLLEQALTQLLDNAFKYSFRDAAVLVTSGYTRATRQVRISVISEGVRLESGEVSMCVGRGWQSDEAKMVSGSGSGIGLWIVNHIMEAHGGKLEITPTDKAGKTTFALLFPT